MLELRIVEGSIFKKVIEAIKDLINDANFDCSVSGLSLNAVDSGLASMVSLLLRAEWFEHYRCDRNVSLGMNLDNMCRMLKCAGNDDIITLQARDDGSDTVAFIFENSSEGKVVNFETNRMEINNEHFEILGEQYQAIVRMPSSEFAKICKDLSSIGDTVVISVTQEGLKFSTRSDIGTANVVCRQTVAVDEPEAATIIEMTQPISLAFSLRYMNSFTKATPLSRTVTISLSSERPLVVEYTIPKMGYIRFNLTSQFEEEDDYQNKF